MSQPNFKMRAYHPCYQDNHKIAPDGRKYYTLSTEQLLQYVKRVSVEHEDGIYDSATVEAEMYMGGLKVTHFLEWYEGRLYDEGCDGVRLRTSCKEFYNRYPNTFWIIYDDKADQIQLSMRKLG